MSRIGRMPVIIPAGVEVALNGTEITVKGPKGTLQRNNNPRINVKIEGNEIIVTRNNEEKISKALHGLTRTLIFNMVEGVTKGYTKNLEINGVGYRAIKAGNKVTLNIGYSHQVIIEENDDIKIDVPTPTQIIISGIDKQKVGHFAADVRMKRPPEPYHGKGIRYADEVIHLKEGKAGKSSKK